jgi:hypothetical protein
MASTSVLGITLTLTPTLLTALRIAPLLSTTASLTHAYMEYVTTSAFLFPAPTTSRLSSAMLKSSAHARGFRPSAPSAAALDAAKEGAAPAWFVAFFNTGVWSVIGLNALTLASAAANLFLFPRGLGERRRFYMAGLVAAGAHYVFVPLVAPSVERLFGMCAALERGEGTAGMEGMSAIESVAEWVGVHKIRMATVDLVALVCFAVGCVGAVAV